MSRPFKRYYICLYTISYRKTERLSRAAPKFLILRIILLEALFLGLGGSILGIGFSFVGRWMLARLVPASLPQAIVPGWWPIAGAIAMGSALLGALYPGLLAALQDPIDAIEYE